MRLVATRSSRSPTAKCCISTSISKANPRQCSLPSDIRAEVVGSLLRPAALVAARRRRESGEMSAADFKREEDREVVAAIRLQEDAGIDVITDGEQRRYAFYGHLVESFDGFDKEGGWAIPFRDEQGEELILKRPVVVEKMRWRHRIRAETSPCS